jgi:mannose-6-phosphate isomerase
MVETQQQSDTTYRLYDYGRPRELHLKEGLAAIKERVRSGKVVRPAPSNLNGSANRRAPLISSPYFVVEMFELKEPHKFQMKDELGKNSAQVLVAIEGCGMVEARGQTL